MFGYNRINNVTSRADDLLKNILIREGSEWTEYQLKNMNEDQKTAVVDNVVTKLFNDIKAKSLHVDFAPIDATRGNIKKLENYTALDNAIKYLKKIASSHPNSKQVPAFAEAVEELSFAFATVQKHASGFENGFRMNNPVVRYIYNSIVVGLIQGTSFVIAESVEFVKDNLNLYKAEVKSSKNIARNNHIKAIASFNDLERKGQMVKLFKDSQTLNEGLGVVGTTIAVIGLIGFALTIARTIIFLYFDTRVRLSQYLKYLKDFVEMNASTLGSDAKKVKDRQMKIASTLGKLSDRIAVDQNVANDRANSEIDQSNKIIALGNSSSGSSGAPDLGLY
jgi:uncharacterized protein YlzI (FlbEa/FlbD family)